MMMIGDDLLPTAKKQKKKHWHVKWVILVDVDPSIDRGQKKKPILYRVTSARHTPPGQSNIQSYIHILPFEPLSGYISWTLPPRTPGHGKT